MSATSHIRDAATDWIRPSSRRVWSASCWDMACMRACSSSVSAAAMWGSLPRASPLDSTAVPAAVPDSRKCTNVCSLFMIQVIPKLCNRCQALYIDKY